MNFKDKSDDELVFLHRQKKADVTFILYQRYKNYCYSIIFKMLYKTKYANALVEERDELTFYAVVKAINTYNKKKGSIFRSYLSLLVRNEVISRIREFAKDPIADYISANNEEEEDGNSFLDTLVFADNLASPKELIDLKEKVNIIIHASKDIKYKQIVKMLEMKQKGFTYKEIAERYKMEISSVRSMFHRIKAIVDKDEY